MKEIDTKQKFILQQCDDYVQSANTLFHFMQRHEYLSALLKRRALVPRYCQENIAYLNLEICNIFLGCTVTIKQYAAPTRKKIAESS